VKSLLENIKLPFKYTMAYNFISAAEAARYVKDGYNIGLSGFTPAGTAKGVTSEIAKMAEAEHAAGRPFK